MYFLSQGRHDRKNNTRKSTETRAKKAQSPTPHFLAQADRRTPSLPSFFLKILIMANYLGSASDLLRHFGDEDDAELDDIPPPGVDGKIFNFLFLHDDTIMMDRDEGEESVDEYKRPTSRKGSSNWYRGLAQQLPKDECSICLCGFDGSDSVELSCGHVFCENCLQEYLKFELSQSWTKVKHTVCTLALKPRVDIFYHFLE
jgi:hypothetical protein